MEKNKSGAHLSQACANQQTLKQKTKNKKQKTKNKKQKTRQ